MSAKEMNPEQVKSLLRHIDATQSEAVKADIFGQLGYACMYCTNTHEWAALFIGNVQKLLDWVNIEQGSRFWEKL